VRGSRDVGRRQGVKRRGMGFPNWYDSGGWKETIHMPSGVG